MKGQPEGTYNRMRKFKIKEISGVHAGAMGEGSNMAIIKRAEIEKRVALTDPMDGHSHTFELDRGNGPLSSGSTSYGRSVGMEGEDHAHDWIHGANGEIIVGVANGHTHRVGFFSKGHPVADVLDETNFTSEQMSARSEGQDPADQSAVSDGNEEPIMTEKNELDPKVQEQLDALKADNQRLTKMAELTDAEKAYHKGLSGDEAEAFLNDPKRAEIVKAAAEADPVVATVNGKDIRKSEDPTGAIAEMVKRDAKREKELKDLKAKGQKSELEKRAGELKHLPGTVETKVAMLKSLDSIEDEAVRQSALESLSAKNSAAGDDFVTKGDSTEPETQEGEDALDSLAKAEMAKDSSLTFEQAYSKALDSDEGQAIYTKSLEG